MLCTTKVNVFHKQTRIREVSHLGGKRLRLICNERIENHLVVQRGGVCPYPRQWANQTLQLCVRFLIYNGVYSSAQLDVFRVSKSLSLNEVFARQIKSAVFGSGNLRTVRARQSFYKHSRRAFCFLSWFLTDTINHNLVLIWRSSRLDINFLEH